MPTRRQRFPMGRPGAEPISIAPPNVIKEEERLPDISELGIPSTARRQLIQLTSQHVQLGTIQRQAEKDRKGLTETIKGILKENVSLDETPKFYVDSNRVAYYKQSRSSLDKDLLRAALLTLGVPAAKVDKAIKSATKTSEVETLRITAPGEED